MYNMRLVIKKIKTFVNEFTKYIIKSRFSKRQSSRLHMQDGHDPCKFSPPPPISCLVLPEANVYLTNTSRRGVMSPSDSASYLHHTVYVDCWINTTGSLEASLISQSSSVHKATQPQDGLPRICSLIPCQNNGFSSPKHPVLAFAPAQARTLVTSLHVMLRDNFTCHLLCISS